MNITLFRGWKTIVCGLLLSGWAVVAQGAEPKKILLIAGTPSHGPGQHEFNAGVRLLARCLEPVPGVKVIVQTNGWPADPAVFDGVNAIFLYMDGGPGHPILQEDRLKTVGELMKKGVGLGCAHYATEVPKGAAGQQFRDWIGGYYETGYSTNPEWNAGVTPLPGHPITRGVQPFKWRDEWYFNIRFRPEMNGVDSILTATPSDRAREEPSRGRYPHILEGKGREETLLWAVERSDGGRGFGFTGGHFHKSWGNDQIRKTILNALLWSAKVEVPAQGVESSVTAEELKQNQDLKVP